MQHLHWRKNVPFVRWGLHLLRPFIRDYDTDWWLKNRDKVRMRYTFGSYVLDTARRELRCHGQLVPLEPKGYQVLLYLTAHAERVVTRDELLAHAWPDVYVVDTTVARCLTLIRKAVGDSGTRQKVIRTLHGHGYRFVAPLAAVHEAPAAEEPKTAPEKTLPPPSGAAPSVAGAPETRAPGERRHVSVMSGVLTPVFGLLSGVDVETQQTLLEQLDAAVRRAVTLYDGRILQLASDRFSVVFGVPRAYEDHADRAVLAALAFLRQWAALDTAWHATLGRPITLGVGIHSGLVVAPAGNDTTVAVSSLAGDVLPLAEHLARHGTGTILISAAVAAAAGAAARIERAAPIAVDGRNELAVTYRVSGPLTQSAPGTALGMRHRGPFVGRQGDLGTLLAQFDHVRAGHGRGVGITGPSGMGKTRLTSQFLRHFGPGDCSILYGRCQSHGQHTPYLPLMDLLNRWWGIDEADTAVVAATKAEAASRAPDGPPAGTGTRLLGLLGVPSAAAAELLAPRELRARTFAALHGLFIHHSEQKPLIIVIEDLHWIDATSEEYLTELSGRLATRRLLLLMTFRSGYRPPWQTQSIYTQLAIAPLLDEESRMLVRATRRGRPLSTPLEAQIVARSRGNPFFLEALTQAVTEQAAPASTLDVPDTIQSLLEARIDRLSGPAKHLLQVAAVIGPDVPLRLLRGLAALPDGVIDDALQGLEVTELLYETRPSPDSIYGFQHGLVQDVAYQSLLRQTRRELHRRAVMLLEAQAAEAGDGHDVPQRAGGLERLAHHATQGELWESAVRYGQQAGMRAFARGSNAEAVAALEQAIAVSEHLPQDRATVERAIDLRLALRSALLPAGDFARTLACVREAEELAESLGDHQRVAQAAFFLSLHLYVQGQHAEAVRAGQRAQALTAGRDPIVHAIATYLVGIPLQALGLHSRATECFEQSLTALGGPRRLQFFNLAVLPSVTSCAFLATCNAELGRFEQARTRGAEGLEIAEAAAHPPSTMFAAWGAGWAAFRQADTPRALSLLVRALDICRDSGLVLHFPMVAVPLAGTYVLAGRAGDAVALLRHTIDQVVAHDMANFAGVCRFALAEALLETGGIDEAAACAGEALAVARRQEERGYEAYALRVLGDAARRRGDICASLERARESLAIAGALGMAPLEAHCHADIGAAYAAMGHPGQAREALERSIERYRAIAMRWHEQRALASLAQLP